MVLLHCIRRVVTGVELINMQLFPIIGETELSVWGIASRS